MKPLPEVKWLLEESVFGEDIPAVVQEIQKQGMAVEVVKYRPFANDPYDMFHDDDCVIAAGSINLIKHIQKTKPWLPGSFANFKNHDCQTYYAYYGKHLLNSDYRIMPLGELERKHNDLQLEWGNIFIRPCNGTKTFTGQILNIKSLKEIETFGRPDLPIVASMGMRIGAEYRIFCTKDYPICGSQYRNDSGELEFRQIGTTQQDIMAGAFARCILEENTWFPDPIFALDIAFLRGSVNPYLLEISSFSCSGWYDSPLEPLIREASRLAQEEWMEHHAA